MTDKDKERIRKELDINFEYDILSREEKRKDEWGITMPFTKGQRDKQWEQFLIHHYLSINDPIGGDIISTLSDDTGISREDIIQYLKEETLFIRIRDNVK